jgi:hypothetical protein
MEYLCMHTHDYHVCIHAYTGLYTYMHAHMHVQAYSHEHASSM